MKHLQDQRVWVIVFVGKTVFILHILRIKNYFKLISHTLNNQFSFSIKRIVAPYILKFQQSRNYYSLVWPISSF
jgi:hypothetical protein